MICRQRAAVGWHNNEHCHSRIGFVRPSQRYCGNDKDILHKRKEVYQQAKEKNPLRWSSGTRKWEYIKPVDLNPDRPKQEKKADI